MCLHFLQRDKVTEIEDVIEKFKDKTDAIVLSRQIFEETFSKKPWFLCQTKQVQMGVIWQVGLGLYQKVLARRNQTGVWCTK
jgi:hypothetical protein